MPAGGLVQGGADPLGARELALVGGLALVGSAAPLACFYIALALAPAARVSAFFFMVPIVGVVTVWPLTGESPGPGLVVGLVAVSAGLRLLLARAGPQPGAVGRLAPAVVTSPPSPRPLLALSGGTGGAKLLDGLAQAAGQQALCASSTPATTATSTGCGSAPTWTSAATRSPAWSASAAGATPTTASAAWRASPATAARPGSTSATATWPPTSTAPCASARAGPSEITAEICERLGVAARVLPMSDQSIQTRITTPGGVRSFQEYLVERGAREPISRIELLGVEAARPAPGLLEQIAAAERIVICPSSPVVSIGTILAVPGVRAALAARRERTVAVSPIVGKRPVEGPADRFLAGAGYPECTATQMARIYADVAATFVLDRRDADEAPAIEALGVRPVLLDALMPDRQERLRLARQTLAALEAGG